MIKFFSIIFILFSTVQVFFGQGFNMVKKAQVKVDGQLYNDVWGYERPNGQKFAVVGTRRKTLIYDVTECGNPIEVFNHTFDSSSVWRDYKAFGNAVYGTADQASLGLQIINMNTYTMTNITTHFLRAHNIYVDTAHARLYVAGSNSVRRGLIVYDISNPLTPVHLKNIHIDSLVGAPGLNTYVHDVYVRDNIAYTSNGAISRMYQMDVSDLNNVEVMATYTGPSGYNHSSWVSEDGQYVYEALEVPKGMPINVYRRNEDDQSTLEKISDFKDPLEFPVSDINRPHNPFVHENKLYISYYEDGVQVYDVANPAVPKRIAYYDTYPQNNGSGYGNTSSFNGCWGVYPFMSSGCILAADIENGFYTLELDLPEPEWNSHITLNKALYMEQPGRGVVLRSPKGYCFQVGVNSNGEFILTRIVCQSNFVEEEYMYRADLTFSTTGESVIAKNMDGNCYQLGLNVSNQVTGNAVPCPGIFNTNVKLNNTNLIIDTYTKGIVLYNPAIQRCVRLRVNDNGTFNATNLSSCP